MRRLRCDACRAPVGARVRAHEPCPRCDGALRVEARCAWCLAWTSAARCEGCESELVPVPDFGAARMLRDGGVDRYALADRTRALSAPQHAALSRRFDADWAALGVRLEEARFVAASLVSPDLAERVETALIGLVPVDPKTLEELRGPPSPPFEGEDALAAIEAKSPWPTTRDLASIARLHRGAAPRETLRAVERALHHGPESGAEAALALTRAVLRGDHHTDRDDDARIARAASPGVADPVIGPWAAVALGHALDGARRALDAAELAPLEEARARSRAALERALVSVDPELSLGAALLLEDEPRLAKIAVTGPPALAARALRALASRASPVARERLRRGDTSARLEILRALPRTLDREWLDAILEAIGADPAVRARGLAFLREERFESSPHAMAIGAWARRAALSLDERLELLEWSGCERAFVEGVSLSLLEEAPDRALVERRRVELGAYLSHADPAVAAQVLDRWLDHGLLERVLELHAERNGYGVPADDRALELLLGAFDRAPARLAERLEPSLERRRGYSGMDRILDALWARVDDGRARADAARAARGFRQELKERRRRAGGVWSASRGAEFLRLVAPLDPLDLPALVREAMEAEPADLVAMVEAVEAETAERLSSHPNTMMCAIANLASSLVGRFRGDDEDPAANAGVDALADAWERWRARLSDARAVSEAEARVAHLVEQVEVELRIARELRERKAERAREALARELERARRAREAEEARAAEETRAAEALRQARALLDAQGHGGGASIDREPFVPGPLPTLEDYAAFLRAMSAGADVMALFAAKGLTPESWGACASAWSAILATRTDLALRFGALLTAR